MEQERSGSRVDPTVFYVSLVVVLAFVAWGVLFTDNIAAVTGAVLSYVMTNFGWVLILSTLSFLVFMLYLAFSRYGGIRLGRDEEEPEFHTVSWVAGGNVCRTTETAQYGNAEEICCARHRRSRRKMTLDPVCCLRLE